ncbi:MAG: polymerase [Candidatus Sumerlaeota bacterium]|nr:polymerase [Candidatus Sumerlaeota bacterium]
MTTPPKTIIHVDMDCFYVSVERLHDPSLIGKPVAVGGPSSGRGVVSSASYEARAYGVRSAMPCSQALRLCPHLIIVSHGFGHYAEYSRRAAAAFRSLTPLVEMASQDEAYLDMTGTERLWGAPLAMAGRLRQTVFDETRLPCSLGIGSNRMIAKIASALCKPAGLLWVPAGSETAFLRPLPIRRIPGLGPKAQERLGALGIKTIGQIQELGENECARLFGNQGAELHRRALGQASATVGGEEAAKSISNETTFEKDSADADFLNGVLAALSEKVGSRLRAAGLRARTIGIKYRYAGFETHTAAVTLAAPTHDDLLIYQTARDLLAARRHPGRPLRLVGVATTNLGGDGEGQMDLLSDGATGERRERLLGAIDALRAKHGFASVRSGTSRSNWREE